MPRWNKELKVNCQEVMEQTIKNLNPDLYQKLLVDLLSIKIENNKKIIEQFIRQKLNLTTNAAPRTKSYWLSRGWTYEESHIKAKKHKSGNPCSVYSRNFWLNKINPITGKNYTEDEADQERNSRRPIRKEYWINKGFSLEEAIKLAKETKRSNNKLGAEKKSRSNLHRVSSPRCIEYYTARGYSAEESALMLSNSQKYFSKEICVQKYGENEGMKIWQDRQNKWQGTLNSKSAEEKSRINRLKLTKGITVSKAEKLILKAIKETIPDAIHQFTLHESGKKQYIYDIMANNKIIEYNGDFWHSNPSIYSPDFINPRTKVKSIDKWASDAVKLQCARDQGYEVLIIWEHDFKKNQKETIKKCIQFLTS